MRKNPPSESGAFNPRILAAFVLCSVGVLLGMGSFAAMPSSGVTDSADGSSGDSLPGGTQVGPLNGSGKMAPPRPPRVPGTAGWSIVTSPNATAAASSNDLYSVTCTSASDCWAVGPDIGVLGQTLIEHWNGTLWSIVSSPNTSTPFNFLSDVKCALASECWAVGSYSNGTFYQTLIERWNGTSWSIVTSPSTSATQHNSLASVTCASASQCWAVGYYYTGSVAQTLIERWNGTSWSIVASPNSAPEDFNQLSGVTCASASDCWAVGSTGDQTLIEHWNGTSWSIVASANSAHAEFDQLSGVTCASASQCWAVGYYYTGSREQTLIEQWDGTSWSIVTSPNTTAAFYDELLDVTCASARECWAVGYYSDASSRRQTLVEHWNGTLWSIVASPNAEDNILLGVACTSALECWAVGHDGTAIGSQTLIQRWNGSSWSIVTSPNASETPDYNQLYGATCASTSECWAVGARGRDQTLIEQWDGTSWSIVSSPDTNSKQFNALVSVTCTSVSDCWAIGGYETYSGAHPLTEHWNGTSWSIVASPTTGETQSDYLYGVTCASASDCWTVGSSYNFPFYQTLIEHWDGTSWSIVASPNTDATQNNELRNVTCASATQCWAVGYYSNGSAYLTLIEYWNGTSWVIVSSPNPSHVNGLRSVTCSSASECWAVGFSYTGTVYRALIERWDGASWSVVASPNTSATQPNALASVTCVSASHCWAVGSYNNGSVDQTLIEQWNGTSWSIVPSPTTSSNQVNDLEAVTCATASQCWAVGTYYAYSGFLAQTLIEEFSSTIPPLTSVVSSKIHGNAGTFDIDLPLIGNPGIECRISGATGTSGIDYKVIFSFVNPVTSCGVASIGSASFGPNLNQCTVNLSDVPNAHYTTVSLNNVLDSQNNGGNVSVPMGLLVGDVSGDGRVTPGDASLVKTQVGTPVTESNFRADVFTDGSINTRDIRITKGQGGNKLRP